jgi:pilus assembly protein CpaB
MRWRRRWPRSTKLFLAAGLLCALGAGAIVHGSVSRSRAAFAVTGPPVPVVVAARSVARGDALTGDDLVIGSLPGGTVPPGAFHDLAGILGRITLTDLAPGEVVTITRLAPGAGPLAALVPPGLRAVPIVVPVLPPGLVPGDRVDVMATFGEGRTYTETAGRDLEILVVPGNSSTSGLGAGAGGSVLVVLADTLTTSRIARASGFAVLSVAVVGPSPAPNPPPSATESPTSVGTSVSVAPSATPGDG